MRAARTKLEIEGAARRYEGLQGGQSTLSVSSASPRLIVNEPAIGHRSMLAENFREGLEVILKSGKFRTASLPGAANYGWLEHGPEKWTPVFRADQLVTRS